jgi:uncharacterized lipoprotein
VNRIQTARWSVSVLVAATALGGCSLFHHHDSYYGKATESRPLEVPPDLDTSTPSNAPPAVSIAGETLRVADSVEHTWQRVGLAIERAQLGEISARDAESHSYTLEVAGLRAAAPIPAPQEHHWYSRILHPFGGDKSSSEAASSAPPVNGHLNVKVTPDGDGARVEVEGPANDAAASEAARRVLQALRERLS